MLMMCYDFRGNARVGPLFKKGKDTVGDGNPPAEKCNLIEVIARFA